MTRRGGRGADSRPAAPSFHMLINHQLRRRGQKRRTKNRHRWLDEAQTQTGHMTHGTTSCSLCHSSWCHYSRRLCEFEQIGQSARIIRRKTLLIWHRLPQPRSCSRSTPENRVGGAEDFQNMSAPAPLQRDRKRKHLTM